MENWIHFHTSRLGRSKVYKNLWWVSDHGNIKITNTLNDKVKYPKTATTGGHMHTGRYAAISINDAPEKYVHRIVATHFIPNPDNKPTVNHKDGDKLNNHVSNLEWMTHSENNRHAWDIGLNSNRERLSEAEKERRLKARTKLNQEVAKQKRKEERAKKLEDKYKPLLRLTESPKIKYAIIMMMGGYKIAEAADAVQMNRNTLRTQLFRLSKNNK